MNSELSNKALMALAPSVFAKQPWEGVSPRYAFVPTIATVDALRDTGFAPVSAGQSKVRISAKRNFTKHLLRFRHRDDLIIKPKTREIIEVVLTNSHDRSSAYCLDAGVFKVVCKNGMVVKSADFGSYRVQHSGNIIDEVIAATNEIVRRAPQIREQVSAWRAASMTPAQRLLFAEAVLITRYGLTEHGNLLAPLKPEQLIAARRDEDGGVDLWTTANVIQENLMRGDIEGIAASGRRIRTRAIKSVNSELDINRSIWLIAEEMAERMGV